MRPAHPPFATVPPVGARHAVPCERQFRRKTLSVPQSTWSAALPRRFHGVTASITATHSAAVERHALRILQGCGFSDPYSNRSAQTLLFLLSTFNCRLSTSSSHLTAATRAMLPLLPRLRRRFLMRYLRFQLLILRRQIRILLRQRVHSPRQICILLLQIRQLPLKLLILLPRLRILASRQRKSQTHRQQQNRCSVFPHSFSLSLGDWLRERPSVVAPSAPRHKPYPAPCVGAQHAAPHVRTITAS
jgi:hypothetical protein